MERLSDHYDPLTLLDDVLARLHRDKELAALLVGKLKAGCEGWLSAQRLGNTGEPLLQGEGHEERAGEEDFKHVSRAGK